MNGQLSPDGGGGGAPLPPGDPPALRLKKILVPLDFSDHSLKALLYARSFAKEFGAALFLLHVTEPVPYPSDVGFSPVMSTELEGALQKDAEAKLKEIVSTHLEAGTRVEMLFRTGRSFQEIADAADEVQADLIIVTTHGYTGIKHVLLGSTAERVVRHARCPVLVVRDLQEQGSTG